MIQNAPATSVEMNRYRTTPVIDNPCRHAGAFASPTESGVPDAWWGPSGYTLVSCELDFRPRGASRICMRSPEGRDHWVEGLSLEMVEPERIVFAGELEVNGRRLTETPGTITFRRC